MYVDEKTVEKIVSQEDIVNISGKQGAIIFVDTTCLHRGGFNMLSDRFYGVWSYVSPASLFSKRIFDIRENINNSELSNIQKFCLDMKNTIYRR